MNDNTQIDEFKKALDSAKSIFVLLPQNPSLDATASALALFLSLKEEGRSVFIACPSKMRVEYSSLVGVDQISDKIGNRNLIISFDYAEDSIEKVSYNVEAGKFNLVIEPKPGFKPIGNENVEFNYEGIEADLVIVVGTQRLENLAEFYEKERENISKATVVNLDRAAANTNFGQINLVRRDAGSISEIVFRIIKNLSLHMNVDIAGNLLKGIESQTNNFQAPFAGAETFEAAAQLLRAGAKRSSAVAPSARVWDPHLGLPQRPSPAFPTIQPPVVSQMIRPATQVPPPQPTNQIPTQPTDQTQSLRELTEPRLQVEESPDSGIQPGGSSADQPPPPTQPAGSQKKGSRRSDGENKPKETGQEQPQEWLKPKIYKGSSKV